MKVGHNYSVIMSYGIFDNRDETNLKKVWADAKEDVHTIRLRKPLPLVNMMSATYLAVTFVGLIIFLI